jgi:uncharacterized membrane protein YuzA (DUF378 family)
MKMSGLGWVAWLLVVIGGLNWGLVGLLNYNLVSSLFGTGTLTNLIYDLVGLSALYMLFAGARK